MVAKGFDLASAVAFDNAAAGHDGILSDPSGALIYKPCTPAEVAFYQSTATAHPEFARLMPTFMGTLQRGQSQQLQHVLSSNQASDAPDSAVLPTPELEDVLSSKESADKQVKGKKLDTDLIVVMENVLAGFKRPNLMDIKIGKRLWADDAALAKRAKLDDVASATTSGSLGLRIAGMQIWEPSNVQAPSKSEKENTTLKKARGADGGYRAYDKIYGQRLRDDDIEDAFKALLAMGTDGTTEGMLEHIIRDIDSSIEEIETVVSSAESRMYSASLLVVFEGDPATRQEIIDIAIAQATNGDETIAKVGQQRDFDAKADDDGDEEDDEDDEDDEQELEKKLFDIKVIDFAHAAWTPGQGPDENFLHGVRNVRKIFQRLLPC